MINSGADNNGQIGGLCQSLHVAGIKKVMPWITPVIECLPMSRSIDSFRSRATQLFHNRLQRGRGPGMKDVFFHLVSERPAHGCCLLMRLNSSPCSCEFRSLAKVARTAAS